MSELERETILGLLAFVRSVTFLLLFPFARLFLRPSGCVGVGSALAIWLAAGGEPPQAPFLLLVLRELLVGALTALPLVLLIEAIGTLGQLTDFLRGAQAAEQLSPLSGERHSPLEQLLLLLGAWMIVLAPAPYSLPALLALSTELFPLGSVGVRIPAPEQSLALLALILGGSFSVIAPLAAAILALEFFGGIMNRFWGGGNPGAELVGVKLLMGPAALAIIMLSLRMETILEAVSGWLDLR